MYGKGARGGIVEPSDYIHTITIQKMDVEKNAFNEPVDVLGTCMKSIAAFEPHKGSEWPDLGGDQLAGEKRQALSIALFRLPYFCLPQSMGGPAIDPAIHQIVFKGKIWDIRAVNEMPMGLPVEWHVEAQNIT